MTPARQAVLILLQDEDPRTVLLVKEQLAQGGVARLEELRDLLSTAEPRAAGHLNDVIAEIEEREAEQLFEHWCARFPEHGDLEEAAWKVAGVFLPGLEIAPYRAMLDSWGAEVGRRLKKAHSERDRVETLVEFLGSDLGLRGNKDDYNNISNSLLPEVLDSRLGLPLTLSLVYMFVGKRAGLEVLGVALPGHFVVRSGEYFFDPYHGGRRLGLEECRALLEQRQMTLHPGHLQSPTARQVLSRMLANIFCLARESDPPLAERVGRWISALRGESEPGLRKSDPR